MADSYTLGPISAGADSPLGALLGFAQGISSNFATGQEIYVNNPAVGNAIISGQPLSPAGITALQAAVTTPRSSNPLVAFGQDIGSFFGAGGVGLGTIIGTAGQTGGSGIAAGASGAVGGISTLGASALGGGLQGLFSGSIAGIGNALGVGSDSAILIAGGLAILLLFLLLR